MIEVGRFFLESLHLLYEWFFRPLTVHRRMRALDPEVDIRASLFRTWRQVLGSPAWRRFLAQAFTALALGPVLLNVTAELIRWSAGGGAFGWVRVAGGVAFGVACGVLGGVLGGVVFGVVFGVALGVASGVLGGVASGVLGGVASGVMVGAMFGAGVVAGMVASSVVFGAAVGVALGVAVGVVFGVMVGVVFGVMSGVVSGVVYGPQVGLAIGLALILSFWIAYFRLWLYAVELPLHLGLAALGRAFPARALRLWRLSPIHWDEMIWLPLLLLDRQLVGLARQDRAAGLAAIEEVARTFRQDWAARRALLALAAEDLAALDSAQAIAAAPAQLAWLYDDPSALPDGLDVFVVSSASVSQQVAAAQEATSRHRQLLGLSRARQMLDEVSPSLVVSTSGSGLAQQFAPVIDRWRGVIGAEISRLTVEAERIAEIPNPFVAGGPVRAEEARVFAGRDDLFRVIEESLAAVHQKPTLVLYGQRRSGKTSLLCQLPRRLPPHIVPVYVDVQGAAQVESTGGFYYNLASAAVREAQQHRRITLPSVSLSEFAAEPGIALNAWCDQVADVLGERLLFVTFDEFEKLEQAIDAGRLSEGVLDTFRNLIQHRPGLLFLFAGVRTLEEMSRDWHSYFISVRPVKVSYLAESAARELITNPMDDFPLNYEPAAVGHILEATRCQPFLVQLACFELVNLLNSPERRAQGAWRRATLSDVEAALQRALDQGRPYFANLWADSTPGERLILAALAEAREPLDTARLAGKLAANEALVLRDLRHLEHRDLVEAVDDRCAFQVPLTRIWVAREKPLALVQAESEAPG
jgi:hypothetical protein